MKQSLSKKVPFPYALGILSLLAVLVIWAVFYKAYEEFLPPQNRVDESSVLRATYGSLGRAILFLDFGTGEKRKFEGDVIRGMTVYDALGQSAKAGGFAIDTKWHEKGVAVEAIDGVRNESQKKWHFYLNNSYKDMTSPLDYVIQGGDTIEFRYE